MGALCTADTALAAVAFFGGTAAFFISAAATATGTPLLFSV